VRIWCGWYVGLNAGDTVTSNNSVQTTGAPVFAAPTFASEDSLAALLATNSEGTKGAGGGQIGYNYQFDRAWIVGLEADIQGAAGVNSSGGQWGSGRLPD
jgi:outer membrane immunogenic protein